MRAFRYLQEICLWLVALFWLLVSPTARAQSANWQMVASGGGTATVTAMASSPAGDLYLTGYFAGTVSLGAFTLISAGTANIYDVFVAKWSPATGSFVWALQGGGTEPVMASALAVSGSYVYLTGRFYGATATFGSQVVSNGGARFSYDAFVTKLTDFGGFGSFTWAQRGGGRSDEFGKAIAVNGTSIYVAGDTYGTSVFGTTTLTNRGYTDVFIAKLTDAGPTGSFDWAQQAGGAYIDEVQAIAASSNGVYITGNYQSTPAAFGSTSLSRAGYGPDAFVAKLTDSGSFVWAQRAGGPGGTYGNALAVNGSNVYVAGGYYGASSSFGNTTLPNATPLYSDADVFVAKLVDAGASAGFAWAQRAGGTAPDAASALAVQGSNVYVTGNFSSASAQFGNQNLTNVYPVNGAPDLFVTKLLDNGSGASFAWALQAGGRESDVSRAIAVVGNNVYVAGEIYTPANFGGLAYLYPSNSYVNFLASIADGGTLATTGRAPGTAVGLAPNPAHAMVAVQLPAKFAAVQVSLALYDALGRLVLARVVPPAAGGQVELSLQGLPPGLYRLLVQAGNEHSTHSLLVE